MQRADLLTQDIWCSSAAATSAPSTANGLSRQADSLKGSNESQFASGCRPPPPLVQPNARALTGLLCRIFLRLNLGQFNGEQKLRTFRYVELSVTVDGAHNPVGHAIAAAVLANWCLR